MTEETIAAVLVTKPIQKLDAEAQTALRDALSKHDGAKFTTEEELSRALDADLAGLGLSRPAAVRSLGGLAVRDEDAPVVTDRKGNPEPDPELRDNENVPLPPEPVSFEEDPTGRLASLELSHRDRRLHA